MLEAAWGAVMQERLLSTVDLCMKPLSSLRSCQQYLVELDLHYYQRKLASAVGEAQRHELLSKTEMLELWHKRLTTPSVLHRYALISSAIAAHNRSTAERLER